MRKRKRGRRRFLLSNQRLNLPGTAILAFRASTFLQAAPAGYPWLSRKRASQVLLSISDSWRVQLQAKRQQQLPEWSHYMLPVEEAMGVEVVLLQYGLGAAAFLGLDGRGYGWNAAEDCPPRPIDNGPTLSRLIVWAAKVHLSMWELTELLPPCDEHGVTCPICAGRRCFEKPEEEWPGGFVCMACSGLGWIDKSRLPRSAAVEPA
jgi:hypothetical protein